MFKVPKGARLLCAICATSGGRSLSEQSTRQWYAAGSFPAKVACLLGTVRFNKPLAARSCGENGTSKAA